MDYRAIIVDFDRTLLHTDKTISEYTVKVLLDLQKSGIRLFAATARPERAITDYCEMIPFDAVTTLNGARTIAKEDVFENPMNPHSAEEILLQLDHIPGMVISLETGSGLYANTDIPIWMPTATSTISAIWTGAVMPSAFPSCSRWSFPISSFPSCRRLSPARRS